MQDGYLSGCGRICFGALSGLLTQTKHTPEGDSLAPSHPTLLAPAS